MSCVKLNPDSVYSIMLQYLVNRNSFHRFIVVFQWDRTYSPPCIRDFSLKFSLDRLYVQTCLDTSHLKAPLHFFT